MDIFAHSLWANALARKGKETLEKKGKPPINIAWATFFGVFPDLFAFTIPFIVRLHNKLVSRLSTAVQLKLKEVVVVFMLSAGEGLFNVMAGIVVSTINVLVAE